MRKLYYVGNKDNETVKTASYNEMKELEAQGFKFKTLLKEEKEELSDEEKEYREKRFAKLKRA